MRHKIQFYPENADLFLNFESVRQWSTKHSLHLPKGRPSLVRPNTPAFGVHLESLLWIIIPERYTVHDNRQHNNELLKCCEATKYFNELFSRRKDKYANRNYSKKLGIYYLMICGTTIKRMAYIRYPRIKHYNKSERIEREKLDKIELLYSILMDNRGEQEKKSEAY